MAKPIISKWMYGAMAAILVVSFALRLLYLNVLPVALSHDETDNIIQAHAVIQTGTDIEGTWHPWSLLPNSGVMAELGPLINVPVLSLLPQSLLTARLTTVVLSSLFPLLLFCWLLALGARGKVATMAALLMATSPWHLIFSRTALEQPTSLFFYMLSWICLARLFVPKESRTFYLKYIVCFVLSYALGFFTYHGYKFALPGMTVLYIIWLTLQKKPYPWRRAGLMILIVGLLLVRTMVYVNYYQSRASEIVVLQNSQFSGAVDAARRQSLAPSRLKSLFSNKPLAMYATIRDKYLGAISPDLLFLHGESNGVFSVYQAGYLYVFTLPFLLAGIWYCAKEGKGYYRFLLLLLLISPLASVIHVNNSYAFRSAIYFVLLNVVLAHGIVWVDDLIRQYYPKLLAPTTAVFTILLLSGLASFCYIYYFVTPITNANDYFFTDRLIGNYVRLNQNHKILLIMPQPRYTYSAILLAKGTPGKADIESFGHLYSPAELGSYAVGNLTIVRSCPPSADGKKYDTVIIDSIILSGLPGGTCPALSTVPVSEGSHPHAFVSPKDSGETARIIGDTLCKSEELRNYVHPENLRDFALEKMSAAQFCATWVVQQ